jgi:hypothetical protein
MYSKYLYSTGGWLTNFEAILTFDLPLSANIKYYFVFNLQTLQFSATFQNKKNTREFIFPCISRI